MTPVTQSLPSTVGPLRVEHRPDGVVLLTFALPEKRNVMSPELTEAWGQTIATLRRDRSVRAVVVTGEGTAFCAGGDVSWLASEPDASPDDLRDRMLPFYETWLSVRTLDVPTIAALNGPAVGAGLCLALACDLRFATPTAKLSVPFTSLGMHPGMAGTFLLPEVVGVAKARELFFTGRAVQGEEAERIGLVNGLFPAEGFVDSVLGVASTIAAAAPVATRLTKVALAYGGHADQKAALAWEALAQPVTLATKDLLEGLAARGERRPPVFTGR